jgi:GntR family transcriptional regulator
MAESPAYQKVADSIRGDIASGQWVAGDALPSEAQLMETHGVSRNTVRHALAVLGNSNLVRRQQGRGTFVAEQGVSHVLGDLRSFTSVIRELGMQPGIDHVDVRPDPNPPQEARDFLNGSHLWLASRTRLASGRPFCVMDSWLPDHIGAELDVDRLRREQSLYTVLADDLGIVLAEATEVIRAQSATERLAEALEVSVGYPMLTISRWSTDHRGQPVEFVRSYSPGDRYEYVIKLRQ